MEISSIRVEAPADMGVPEATDGINETLAVQVRGMRIAEAIGTLMVSAMGGTQRMTIPCPAAEPRIARSRRTNRGDSNERCVSRR